MHDLNDVVCRQVKLTKDLFGLERRSPRPAYEAALEERDKLTRPSRAARVRWLKQKLPSGGLGMPGDTWFVFSEARSTFVEGYFVATVVLSAAFAEHWMIGQLEVRGFAKDARTGLAGCVRCARRECLWSDFLLDRVDYLRTIRNPFVHLKEMGHEHSLTGRSWTRKIATEELAEGDAKHSLETIFALVQTGPR